MFAQSNLETLNAVDLKQILREIKTKQSTWSEERMLSIVKSMMDHIGTIDSELRDELIYRSFCQLILENMLEENILVELLQLCLSEAFLFKGIGDNETDTVFTRSFTTLLITLILYRDNEEQFLSKEAIYKVKDAILVYIKEEIDTRGYVPVKGWAHSIAHVADAFDQLVQNKKIETEIYPVILTALWEKMFTSTRVYIHGEDERVLRPIFSMVDNGLPIKTIEVLLKNIPLELKHKKERLNDENYYFLQANCKIFLNSLFVKMNKKPQLSTLQMIIENCLKQM